MQPLRPNPKTGYLESHAITENIFDSDKKVKFLQLCEEAVKRKEFPPVYAICDALKVKQVTFYKHLRNDRKFAEDWKEIADKLSSLFTCELATKAITKNGTIANLAILKYLENGSWNEKNVLIHGNDRDALKQVNAQFIDAIDAEIVPEPLPPPQEPPQLTNNP